MAATKPISTADGLADADLTKMLGRSRALWEQLASTIEREHTPVTREWHLARTTGTWHVRLKKGTRTILYLLPREKHFLTAFIFGERAEAAVRAGNFPGEVVKALDESPPCGAGRGIRLVTKTRRDVATMLKLEAIKLAP
jgi:hypothetical protein